MELRMSSLVPEEAMIELAHRFGCRFQSLSEEARLALVTAWAEGSVNHRRLCEVSTKHRADLTKMLAGLVRDGFLVSEGSGRGMVYQLPWQPSKQGSVFALDEQSNMLSPLEEQVTLPQELELLPQELEPLPQELEPLPQELNTPKVWLEWSDIPAELQNKLMQLALPVSQQRRVSPKLLRSTVQQLCATHYLSVRVLAQLLNRRVDDLRARTLTPMVKASELKTAFSAMNDPRQSYTTTSPSDLLDRKVLNVDFTTQ